MSKLAIIGAGLAGLSTSYHVGHDRCLIFERSNTIGGHASSHQRDGFTWDEGPHVSFTRSKYIRDLFARGVDNSYVEFQNNVSNFFNGVWIPHPAQANLFAVPEPLRSRCLDDLLRARSPLNFIDEPSNYRQWLVNAFGTTFVDTFASVYTQKYWTCDPSSLSLDWIGERILYPDITLVKDGFFSPASSNLNYISTVRYPENGGFISFASSLSVDAQIAFNHEVKSIDLKNKIIAFTNSSTFHYEKLVNTIPLPDFIRLLPDAPISVREAAKRLKCSSVLLVNVTANHSSLKPYHWFYVYDKSKLSTRVSVTELLSESNAPLGKTGVQVEVYESQYRNFTISHSEIAQRVVQELLDMGLISSVESFHTQYVPYANVIFDNERRVAQDLVLTWLETQGLCREQDDLDPMSQHSISSLPHLGDLILAGRFGQWKYFWSDDCILRGRQIGLSLSSFS